MWQRPATNLTQMYKILKYDPSVDNLHALKKFVDEAYKINKTFFNTDIDNLTITFLYKRAEMDELWHGTSPIWAVGRSYVNHVPGAVAIFSPSVFAKVSNHSTDEFPGVLAHEIAHMFLYHLYKFRSPMWLTEGLPGFIAGQRPGRHPSKREALKFSSIHSVKSWNNLDSHYRYPQAYLFTGFLITKFGKEELIKFVGSLPKSPTIRGFNKLFGDTFHRSFASSSKEWLSTLPD